LFARSDGLSGDFITGLFEDREGNIWVATSDGLDRFRDFAVATISVKQGLSSGVVWSVLAARDGSVCLALSMACTDGMTGGLRFIGRKAADCRVMRIPSFKTKAGGIWVSTLSGVAYFENGRFIPVIGVPGGNVHAIAGDRAGNLWIGQDESLLHLLGGSVVERIPWASFGRTSEASSLFSDLSQGGPWLGFSRGGVAYFKDGPVRTSYTGADGLGDGVSGLKLDRDGALWAATEGGLSRVKNGRIATLTSKNGLPCDTVHWAMEDDDRSFWLYMTCGLVRIARTELEAWAADPKRTIQPTVFDSSDGVRSHGGAYSGYSPRVAESTDGKLWFLPLDGVGVIDPRDLHVNKLPPPVHIEAVKADGSISVSRATVAANRVGSLTDDIQSSSRMVVSPQLSCR
jgi:ligand-binding sensor domain-containing protein